MPQKRQRYGKYERQEDGTRKISICLTGVKAECET